MLVVEKCGLFGGVGEHVCRRGVALVEKVYNTYIRFFGDG